jgi:hypothetical protein
MQTGSDCLNETNFVAGNADWKRLSHCLKGYKYTLETMRQSPLRPGDEVPPAFSLRGRGDFALFPSLRP